MFDTAEEAMEVEDDWWADPRNVSYEAFVKRFNGKVKGKRPVTLPKKVILR